MGWTSYRASHRYSNGSVNRKAECDELLSFGGSFEVVKSTMIGSTYYAAVARVKDEYGPISPEDRMVFGVVFLTSVEKGEFYYKDMDETEGPEQDDCPMSIINLLSPSDNEFAIAWRERCCENALRKASRPSLSQLPIGTKIRYYNRFEGRDMVLVKHQPAYQFKRPFWMLEDERKYVKVKNIPDTYEIMAIPTAGMDSRG